MKKRQKKKIFKKFELKLWNNPESILPEGFKNKIKEYRYLTYEDLENAFKAATEQPFRDYSKVYDAGQGKY